ncbi:type II toxin-antitoxin system RelE/ParE family toxin, partial [Escherichia coli]|uniref:type II toxin-antitoxin system RelE family toxin n=1 Tax=Escherichia coli TaxID=562 RepID=UPI00265C1F9D
MAYFLDFDERALKEWRKLGSTVREQLKKKLVEVLESPRIEANKLRGMPDCYKICLLYTSPSPRDLENNLVC